MLSNCAALLSFGTSFRSTAVSILLIAIFSYGPATLSASAASPRASSNASSAAARLINSPTDNYIAVMEYADFWQKKCMPLKVYFHPCSDVPGFESAFLDAFKNCCDLWSTATDKMVRFEYTENQEESDIDVRWTADPSTWKMKPDGSELGACAPSMLMYEGIDHASIFLLTTVNKKHVGLKAMQWAALHELGHAIGLGHSARESDVMKRSISVQSVTSAGIAALEARNTQVALSARDVTTIKIVYAAKEKLDTIRQKNLGKEQTCRELYNEACRKISAGDSGQAIIFLREALTLDSSFKLALQNLMIAYYNCGVELYNKQHYTEAKEVLDRSLELAIKVGTAAELSEMRTIERRCSIAIKNALKSPQSPQSAPVSSQGAYAGRASKQ